MSLTDVRRRLRDHLPQSGTMGVLASRRPPLYWLLVTVGIIAYVGLVVAAVYALVLFATAGVNALVAAATGSALQAGAWFALSVIVLGFLAVLVIATARWASAYNRPDEEDER